jgi:hypothetical protein
MNHPLRLAVGSHRAGSGKGCAMNVISWENGDTTITDLPACADPMLARIVQRVNDMICTHRDGDLLCALCSVQVLDLAHRTVGTSGHGLDALSLRRVYVRVAADQARQVMHLNADPRVEAAIVAAEHWADDSTAAHAESARKARIAAAAAYATADAAYAAADAAAYATADATADAAAAAAADAYAAAAYAAAAAADAARVGCRLEPAHRAITLFTELTGITPQPPDEDVTRRAVANMLTDATQ